MRYSKDRVEEGRMEGDTTDLLSPDSVLWVNVDGLHDVGLIQRLGGEFSLHPLILEDVVSVGQRAKSEEHEERLFVVIQMLTTDFDHGKVTSEQVALVLGEGFVLSFQERAGDVFEPVRDRIRSEGSRIRARDADYLAYALVDAVVDHYFSVLEELGGQVERLDLEVMEDPSQATMRAIHELKQEMLVIRRAVWPVRELVNGMIRSESALIRDSTKTFLRDVYDHAVQIIDTAETLRDVVSGLMDLYLSSVSNRMNEVMKVLTIMASIFIPLSFLAGVYGMNFDFMPELHFRWGYPLLVAVMAGTAGSLLALFRRRGWL
jgi:magnesium transporter